MVASASVAAAHAVFGGVIFIRTRQRRVPNAEAARVADRLHSAAIHLLRRLRRTDPLRGVNPAQLSVLSVLMGGPRTIGDLAAVEQVQPPTTPRRGHVC